ncbi:MAG: hypothetical protein JNL01_04230 [Bdellovibrionales bacterium]|nr:hypothetical protein [Bdellovibrionales bacterium]
MSTLKRYWQKFKDGAIPSWICFLACFFGPIALVLLIAVSLGDGALARGQAIKQFFAYSISKSLSANPWAWLSTHLPCTDAATGGLRLWVEEPPVFHFLSAWGIRWFPQIAAPVSILALFFIFFAAFRFTSGTWFPDWSFKKDPKRDYRLHLAAFSAAILVFSPIVLRYSIQHLPDLLATAFLVLGAAVVHPTLALVFFTLSVTTKALTVIPVAAVLISRWSVWDKKVTQKALVRPALKTALQLAGISAPFALWLFILWKNQIPNPFSLNNVVENRHSGSLGLLIDPHFWSRFFTWTFSKGVGLVALPFFIVRVLGEFGIGWAKKKKGTERTLIFWAASVIPYWLLIRQGNFVHDYYTLPFAFPILMLAISGLTSLPRFKSNWVNAVLALPLILIHGMVGFIGIESLQPSTVLRDQGRPYFCQMESGQDSHLSRPAKP